MGRLSTGVRSDTAIEAQARVADDFADGTSGVVDVERWPKPGDDIGLDVPRLLVLTPREQQLLAHPSGEAELVIIDEHYTVRRPSSM